MSDWIDNDYAIRVFSLLPRYKMVSTLPMKLNARCPICGDSQKDEFKARFWYYEYKGAKFVKCFNCDYSMGFGKFLQDHDEELHREYMMEKFKENATSAPRKEVDISPKLKTTIKTVDKLDFCQRLDTLPEHHPIIKYVTNRCIPSSVWDRLYFTGKWQELCNSVKPDTFPTPKTEYRLVIPIWNKEGKIEAFQGRALKACPNKYMTIKTDEDSSKIYGMDTVDENKDYVLFLEGPLDSLFLSNALAITGGSLSLDQVPFKEKRIWVMDNEPRHPDTIKRMNRLIEAGESVCFWDESPWQSKDINDMIKEDGATSEQILEYILANSCNGLFAQLRMTKYCKI